MIYLIKTSEKSIKRGVAGRFLDFTPSIEGVYYSIRRIVNIFPVVDLFVRKPFGFFLSVGSILIRIPYI